MLAIAQVQAGQTILVQGGSGGVGTLVIQLAHNLGASVITTARKGQETALLQLGADQVIVADESSPATDKQEVDAVLDLVGGDSLARAYALVRPGGVLVTANQPPDPQACAARGIRGEMIQTKVTTAGLEDLLNRIAAGTVVPVVDHTQPLWDLDRLWSRAAPGTVTGKIVYTISG